MASCDACTVLRSINIVMTNRGNIYKPEAKNTICDYDKGYRKYNITLLKY